MRSKKSGFLLAAALMLAVVFGVALKVTAGQMNEAIQSSTISKDASLSASQSVDPCISATSKMALWTSGTCLRGFNVSLFYGVTNKQTDYDAIAAMGANFVRLAPVAIYSKTAPYALDTAAQTDLDNALDMVKKADMFAIIVFFDGPGRNFDPSEAPGELHSVWENTLKGQDERGKWVEMWKYTAARYKDNPIVVGYELMNEPNSNTFLQTPVDSPSDFYPANANTSYDWNPLALKITTAIRQMDTSTPILMGGNNWNAAAWMDSITPNGDSKTVYTFHQYEPQDTYTHQPAPYTNSYGTTTSSCGTTPCTFTRQKDLEPAFKNVSAFKSSKNLPVGNTEFGVERFARGADQWLNDSMDIMEGLGVNYVVHEWSPAALVTQPYYADPIYNWAYYQFGTGSANYVAIPMKDNVLTTVINKYLLKNTVRPSNIGTVTQTGANNCAASVSSSLVLHIPIVTYSGANYWADLQYNSADSTLTVATAGTVSNMSSYGNCTASTLSSDFKLHIPVIILNGLSYRLDLQYGGSIFVITGYGANSTLPQPPGAG